MQHRHRCNKNKATDSCSFAVHTAKQIELLASRAEIDYMQGRIFLTSEIPTRDMREKGHSRSSIDSNSSMGTRSELALNKNKLGFLVATMNECFLIEQKELLFAVTEKAAH